MLRSAILGGALTKVDPCGVWFHPHLVYSIRNQVGLSCELRNPKAMIGVRRKESQVCRRWTNSIAYWNMEFVCGDDAKPLIARLPPELLPDENTRTLAACRSKCIRLANWVDFGCAACFCESVTCKNSSALNSLQVRISVNRLAFLSLI